MQKDWNRLFRVHTILQIPYFNKTAKTFSTAMLKLRELADKARFARVRAARRWSAAYHGSCIDPTYQSHTSDPPPEPPRG